MRSERPAMPGLAALGAMLAAAAVGLAAYASHAATPDAQERLYLAAAFGFGHGAALAALAPQARRRLARVALWSLCLGTLLFAGSLAAAALFGWPTRFAPVGGIALMSGWLALAVDRLRR